MGSGPEWRLLRGHGLAGVQETGDGSRDAEPSDGLTYPGIPPLGKPVIAVTRGGTFHALRRRPETQAAFFKRRRDESVSIQ